MKTTETRHQQIINFLEGLNLDIDFNCHLDESINIKSFEDITDALQENNALECEVIYYSEAIKYLAKNDASLNESMGLAEELGYSISNINSELLASLLKSQDLQNEWYEAETDIVFFLSELEDKKFCEVTGQEITNGYYSINDGEIFIKEVSDFLKYLKEETEYKTLKEAFDAEYYIYTEIN